MVTNTCIRTNVANIGTTEARVRFAQELVAKWVQQLQDLSKIVLSQPQAAYAAFVSGFKHKLTHNMRTIPSIGPGTAKGSR